MTGQFSDQPPVDPAEANEAPVRPSPWRILSTLITVAVSIAIAAVFARSALTSAALFLFIFVALVVAHELAHFATAKLFGVLVLEFGVGFPPRIFAVRFGETEYSLNWMPLGGFVRMLGEEDGSHPRSLGAQVPWKRLIVLASGSLINLALPVVLFAFAFTVPHEVSTGRAMITTVAPNSPAAAAGLKSSDVILSINGREAKNTLDAGRLIRLNLGYEIPVTVQRGPEQITVRVTPRWATPNGQGPTGIGIQAQVPFTEMVSEPPWVSLPHGLQATAETMVLARNELFGWTKGGKAPQVAGPVAIAQTTGEVARQGGVAQLLELAALLSINLGIMNLLPLPMLDGGRALFVVIEVLRRGRRIPARREQMVHLVGMVLFIALTLVVTFSDISRIVAGDSLVR